MTTPAPPSEGKLQALIEKWGGWCAMMLLALIIYQYQTDKAYMQESIAAANARIGSTERAVGRVQDSKANREEVKALQEQWLREKQLQVQKMEQMYDKSVSCVGEGHRQAADEQIVCASCFLLHL